MAGRCARRVPARARLGLGFGLALLALSSRAAALQGAPARGSDAYAAVLRLAGDPGLSDGEMTAALVALLDDLERNAASLDVAGEIARFAAEQLVFVAEGAEHGPESAWPAGASAERRSWTIWELANARVVAGRLEHAERLARSGLEPGAAAPTIEPRLWHVRAEVARMRGRWELQEEMLERMEASIPPHSTYAGDPELARFLAQNHEYRARLLQARTQVLLSLGLLDRSRELQREAIDEARSSGDPSVLVAALLTGFEQALVRGDADEAIALVEGGRTDERLAPWAPLLALAQGMAEVERAREAVSLGEDAAEPAGRARAAFARALEGGLPRVEELKAELGSCDLELVAGQPDAAREHLERARALAAAAGPGGPSSEPVLLAVLAWRLARPAELEVRRAELFAAYARFLEEWQRTPARPGGIGFLHLAWRAQVVSEVIQAELLAAPGPSGAERAFQRLLEAQAMGTLSRSRGFAGVDAAAVRAALLAQERGLLVLLPARDRAHLFVLDARRLEHHAIPLGRDALRRRARAITSALQRPDGTVERRLLRDLHDDLLPGAARAHLASWAGVITVGFDLLGDLPFAILVGEDGATLGSRLATSSLPSVAFGVDLVHRPPHAAPAGPDLVLVVAADPQPEAGLPSLRFGARERERLLAPFDAARVSLIEGAQASRDELLRRRETLAGARVLHFLAHGITLSDRELSAALLLSGAAAEGARVFAAEDAAALGCGGLVILSACSSGRGPPRTGDDRLVHLGGAFLEAGARCVALARFPVEYEATLALMERFHARLAAGDPPAAALRTARALEEDPLRAFHAASFELVGLGFEPVFGR